MKKILSVILVIALTFSVCLVCGGCLDNETALVVSNNGEQIKYSIDDLLALVTQKISVSWLDSNGQTGNEIFKGIYFSSLIPYTDAIGLNNISYTVTDASKEKHIYDKLINNKGTDNYSPFIAFNNDNTSFSVIYPQLTIDMVNKDLWVYDVKKIDRISEKIVLSLSVNDYERQFSEKELNKFKTVKQNYIWTDSAGQSGETEFEGITFDKLGINLPLTDFMMVVEDIDGVEYNYDVDMDFQLDRLSKYLDVELNKNMSQKDLKNAINSSDIYFPELMISVMKNGSLVLPIPQISGDYNKEDWVYNVVSISIETDVKN